MLSGFGVRSEHGDSNDRLSIPVWIYLENNYWMVGGFVFHG
jgi:hypothetical protein